MTAHLYFVAPGTLREQMRPEEPVVLGGDEGRHAVTVKRMAVGEEILLADGEGLLAHCVVASTAKSELTALVQTVEREERPAVTFTLVQALAKGDRDLQALEAATELGVDRVVPWKAERSIVQWKGERAAKAHRKWVAQAEAATKQSRQATPPVVDELAAKQTVVRLVEKSALTLVLHEDAEVGLSDVTLPDAGDVVLVVGPEGGITPGELDAFAAAGATSVRMGRTVLRSSSAGPAALAALFARSRWS